MKMSGDVSTAEALMMAAAIFTLFSAAIFTGPVYLWPQAKIIKRQSKTRKMGRK